MKFDNYFAYIEDQCKKASQKISALARITPFMNIAQKRMPSLEANSAIAHWYGCFIENKKIR